MCVLRPVVFIGCGKRKVRHRVTKAKYLYQGRYFALCLKLARRLTSDDRIFILSAKYGVLSLDRMVSYYDVKLTAMSQKDRQQWRKNVEKEIKKLGPSGHRVFLCSTEYSVGLGGTNPIPPHLPIGKQLVWLRWAVEVLTPKR